MKTIIAMLLLCASIGRGAIITINSDTASAFDFNVEWGPRLDERSQMMMGGPSFATGRSGSTVQWLTQTTRNPYFFFLELHDTFEGNKPRGFSLLFWNDPEYYGYIPTAYGSPNILTSVQTYPLNWTQYGARFVVPVSPVPDGGGTLGLLALGVAGVAALWKHAN